MRGNSAIVSGELVDKITKYVGFEQLYLFIFNLQHSNLNNILENESLLKKHLHLSLLLFNILQAPPPHVSSRLLRTDSIETRIVGR